MTQERFFQKVRAHAEEHFIVRPDSKPSEQIGVYKQFLKVEEQRIRIAHSAGGGGREIANARAYLLDLLLRHLFKFADAYCRRTRSEKPVGLALLAYGGYGRAELSPHSDIDLLFIHDGPARATRPHPYLETVVEQVLYPLWDVGLKVGHATRTIAETIAFANQDMQSKTSLIEARLLTGDKELFESFRQRLAKDCVRGHVDEYIAQRIADQTERHEKFGDSVYMQEPNVKSGCGGLRDFQNLIWMAFFKYGALTLPELRKQGFLEAAEHRELDQAYDFILRVRNELHYMTDRANDIISLGLQPQMAANLEYRQHDPLRRMEAFMREYYLHSRNIFLLTNALADRMALTPAKPSRLGALLRRAPKEETFDGFTLRHGRISATAPGMFREEPQRLLRVFLHAQQRGAELSPELRTQIRQNLKYVDRGFQRSPATRDTLFAILQHKGQVARILRLMHEVELLGKLLPEFGRLTALVQHEFFHRYTADEHTLQVIEHLDRIIDAAAAPHANYKKIFQQLERPQILYLAALLHDSGKAANVPRHAEASLEAARKVSHRLRLSADETEQLVFLVRDHLKLSMLSQRRDLDDHATIEAAARIAKTEPNLDALMLLTFADSIGVGAKAWSEWKEALLWDLYHRAKQALGGTERARHILARRIEQLYREISTKLKGQFALEEIYAHFELMPASYYINTSAEEITRHLRLIHEFIKRQLGVGEPEEALAPVVEWQHAPTQGYSEVAICTWDRLGLFSKICGAFAAAELNILSAHIYTRGDQVVIDLFDVCDKNLGAVNDERAMRTAEAMLQRALTGSEPVDFHPVLAKLRTAQRALPRLREVIIPTIIDFDNDISPTRTIIEVQAEDRLGLLFTITQTFADLGLDISFAKISTEKGAAIDSFYVQDQAGHKIIAPDRLAHIRATLETAIKLLAR